MQCLREKLGDHRQGTLVPLLALCVLFAQNPGGTPTINASSH
jgi:hypothetical protein